MDSKGIANRPSILKSLFGKGGKRASKKNDSPEDREARLKFYCEVEEARKNGLVGDNGRPVNLFTLDEYTEEEVYGVDVLSDDDSDE
jgi:hypothetical protein